MRLPRHRGAPPARFSEVTASVPDRERLWRGVGPHGDWMLDGYSVAVDDRPKPHLVSLARAGTEPPG